MLRPMRIVLIANASAGRGRAVRIARRLHSRLARRGHEIRIVEPRSLKGSLESGGEGTRAELIAIAGGDGTILYALPHALREHVPILPVPVGTENLFARQLGLTADVELILETIERGSVSRFDVGLVNDRPFAVMVSIGPDAGLVHRVAAERNGVVSHASYLLPAIRESLHPNLPPLTLEVDGRTVFEGRRGVLIAANAPDYACYLNLARHADARDGALDFVFLAARSGLDVYGWAAMCALGRQLESPDAVWVRGRHARITSPVPELLYQADGDPFSAPGSHGIELAVCPGALSVMAPSAD